jgi:hypothetical protein
MYRPSCRRVLTSGLLWLLKTPYLLSAFLVVQILVTVMPTLHPQLLVVADDVQEEGVQHVCEFVNGKIQ